MTHLSFRSRRARVRRVVETSPLFLVTSLALAACSPERTTAPAEISDLSVQRSVVTLPTSDNFAFWINDRRVPLTLVSPQPGNVRFEPTSEGRFIAEIDRMSRIFRPGTKEMTVVSTLGTRPVQCMVPSSTSGSQKDVLSLQLACRDFTNDAPATVTYSALTVGTGSLSGPLAFAIADQPFAPSYTPDTANSFTNGRLAMQVERIDDGDWYVHTGTGSPQGSTLMVNSADEHAVCTQSEWKNFGARIKCFDRFGAPANVRFKVLLLSTGRTGKSFGFAWADQRTAPVSVPNPNASRSSSGGVITSTRNAPGDYTVEFAGLQNTPAHTENVQVSAFAGIFSACSVVSVANTQTPGRAVRVQCRNAQGTLADSRFNVLILE